MRRRRAPPCPHCSYTSKNPKLQSPPAWAATCTPGQCRQPYLMNSIDAGSGDKPPLPCRNACMHVSLSIACWPYFQRDIR